MTTDKFYILRVKPGSDYDAVRELANVGMTAFVVSGKRRFRHKRTKKIDLMDFPVLSGYVFLLANENVTFPTLDDCSSVGGLIKGCDGFPYLLAFDVVRELMARAKTGEFDVGFKSVRADKAHRRSRLADNTISKGDKIALEVFGRAVNFVVANVENDVAWLEAEFNGAKLVKMRHIKTNEGAAKVA